MDDFGLLFYNARMYDPVIGRFSQPDTIVPLASQGVQAWDHYAYVNNNPIQNNDPSGHCIWDLCIMEGIGVVELVLAASAIYAGTVAIQNHDEMAETVTNALDEIYQRRNSGQKNRDSLETSSYNSGGNYLGTGYGYKRPRCGWACWLTIIGVASDLVYHIYCSADEEACTNPTESNPTPTSTATSTPTSTPSCPPYIQCPSQTSTFTPTSTVTTVPSSTPTQPSTSILSPTPTYPIEYWHHHILDQE